MAEATAKGAITTRTASPCGWPAAAIRGGKVIGSTDEIGLRAIESPVHVHDLHATMLSLMGLDHEKLTYHFQGRDFRLTDVAGKTDLVSRLKA